MATRTQEAKDFDHYENLEAVRKRPNMYIGSTEPQDGIWTLVREGVDNVIDELANRKPKNPLLILVKAGGTWSVFDNGGGIPVDPHPTKKIPILEMITSRLHAGGKFGTTDANKQTRGTHGIGIKAISALSSAAQFATFRSRKGHVISYAGGKMVGKGIDKLPDIEWQVFHQFMVKHGAINSFQSGTRISFTPDPAVFRGGDMTQAQWEAAILDHFQRWAHISAGLNPGVRIVLDWDGKLSEFHSDDGIEGMVRERIEQEEVESFGKMFHITQDLPGQLGIDFALAFTDFDGFGLRAYTNSLNNPDGGVHVTAAMNALTQTLKKLATKERERECLVQENIREGLIGVLNFRLDEPRFSSQTKEKLVDERVQKPCYETCMQSFDDFFAENPALSKKVITRCVKIAEAKAQYAKTKIALKGLSDAAKRGRMLLPGKLCPAPDCKPGERELFVVEGDSAKGTALKARDSRYQEVLPLRGKIINAMRTANYESRLMADAEIMAVLMSIGYNPDLDDPLSKLRISKFILLTDADDDGYHIRVLFYSFFYRFAPEFIKRGYLYQARTYEFLVKEGKQTYFGDSLEELATKVKNPGAMKNALHLKGWGEIDPDDFATMAFDPRSRVLQKVTWPTAEQAELFEQLMGKDASYRAKLLGLDAEAVDI
jgi:DNA gyrase/topoisomerase IV subunit B